MGRCHVPCRPRLPWMAPRRTAWPPAQLRIAVVWRSGRRWVLESHRCRQRAHHRPPTVLGGMAVRHRVRCAPRPRLSALVRCGRRLSRRFPTPPVSSPTCPVRASSAATRALLTAALPHLLGGLCGEAAQRRPRSEPRHAARPAAVTPRCPKGEATPQGQPRGQALSPLAIGGDARARHREAAVRPPPRALRRRYGGGGAASSWRATPLRLPWRPLHHHWRLPRWVTACSRAVTGLRGGQAVTGRLAGCLWCDVSPSRRVRLWRRRWRRRQQQQ